jgi:hypothetical protein
MGMTNEPSSRGISKWLWLPFSLLLIAGLVLVGVVAGQGGVTSKPEEDQPPQQPAPDPEDVTPAGEPASPSSTNPKLDTTLNGLLEAYQSGGLSGAEAFAASRSLSLSGGRIRVEITASEGGIPAAQEAVEAAGGEYLGHYQDLMEAEVPIEALEPLAAHTEVLFIRVPEQAIPSS